MITIITGVPGSGKTLYTIEKLLLPLVGTSVKGRDEHGNEIEIPRTIYTNINGLQIDHELIDGGDNEGLRDWHKWAKPGAVIVFDEFQKAWPPRANGSKVPDDIQALDTHRHMGVDFILITQSVMNVDRHVHALCGRHLHVRRIANMPFAVVYEWDHCSKSLMFSKSLAKQAWRYDRKVFKLYKSAELHTKQPRRVPALLWFVLVGLGLMAWLGPSTYYRLKERTSGGKPPAADVVSTVDPQTGVVRTITKSTTIPPLVPPSQMIEEGPSHEPERPQIVGYIADKTRCRAFGSDGRQVPLDDDVCRRQAGELVYVDFGPSGPPVRMSRRNS
jgi:zona occludens toxin